MGFLSKLFGGGKDSAVKGIVEAVPEAIRNVRNTFAKNLPPDQQAEFELKLADIERQMNTAQAEINKAEAQSSRFFVAGARPFILWVCGISLAYSFLVAPLLSQLAKLPMPELDMGPLMTLLFGMLGLAGMRSWEKSKGLQDKH